MADPITDLVRDALTELNEMMAADQQLAMTPGTVLIGPGAGLDSVGLVNLVSVVEQLAEQRLGGELGLSDVLADDAGRQQVSTVGGLIEFIRRAQGDRGHA